MTSNHGSGETTPRKSSARALCRRAGVVAVCLVLAVTMLIAASPGATAQADDPGSEAMIVSVHENGDATLTLRIPFDLTDESERTAFEEFRTEENRQQQLLDRYERRLSNIAAETNARTDREMSVTTPEIETATRDGDDVGVVRVTATWKQLAATDGDTLELKAPFDSGFETDRTLVVEPPENHQTTAVSPEPSTNDGEAVWESDRQLDGFELTMEPTGSDGAGPGFGIITAVLALVGVVGVSRRL